MTGEDALRAARYLESAMRYLALANAILDKPSATASITATIDTDLLRPLHDRHQGLSTAETAMAPVPQEYARQIIETCHAAGDLVMGLLRNAPASAQPDMRNRIGEVMAYTADFLIHPAIDQHPAINPYK